MSCNQCNHGHASCLLGVYGSVCCLGAAVVGFPQSPETIVVCRAGCPCNVFCCYAWYCQSFQGWFLHGKYTGSAVDGNVQIAVDEAFGFEAVVGFVTDVDWCVHWVGPAEKCYLGLLVEASGMEQDRSEQRTIK